MVSLEEFWELLHLCNQRQIWLKINWAAVRCLLFSSNDMFVLHAQNKQILYIYELIYMLKCPLTTCLGTMNPITGNEHHLLMNIVHH